MTLTKTPICNFGKKAESFELKSIENKLVTLNDAQGKTYGQHLLNLSVELPKELERYILKFLL